MLVTLFSAKGSPGVTSAALTLASVWPREATLLEADPSGADIAYRCRADSGGTLTQSPNVLGLATAARGDRSTEITAWSQKLANGVTVVPGVSSPTQAAGIASLWRGVAGAARNHNGDVLADIGRIDLSAGEIPLLAAAEVIVPVVSASLESLMHTREVLKDITSHSRARIAPLLVSPIRTAAADLRDVDEVFKSAGVISESAVHLPLDHTGLRSLEQGAKPTGRSRMSILLRSTRPIANTLAEPADSARPEVVA